MDSDLGAQIRKMRKECHMTQEEFGMEVGVTKGTLCSWEKNLRTPSINSYYKVVNVYKRITGKSGADVIPESESPEETAADLKKEKTMTSGDLTSYSIKYLLLDPFGKKTVEDVINAEYTRCRVKGCLEDVSECDISVSAIVDKKLAATGESELYQDYVIRFVKLDTWGRKIVEQTIQTCYIRCEEENYAFEYNKFIANVSLYN
mgnify:CR=1 FL=1